MQCVMLAREGVGLEVPDRWDAAEGVIGFGDPQEFEGRRRKIGF